tara:strand:+ start:596 stop:925 length:330 start_codon:yes stop_codon:yes gene_type:complete
LAIEPGDLHRAVENADWLLYALAEVCKIIDRTNCLTEIDLLRRRIKYGVRSELLSLTTLEGIGRVRARSLFNAGLRNLAKLRVASYNQIASVEKIGPGVARKIKSQISD